MISEGVGLVLASNAFLRIFELEPFPWLFIVDKLLIPVMSAKRLNCCTCKGKNAKKCQWLISLFTHFFLTCCANYAVLWIRVKQLLTWFNRRCFLIPIILFNKQYVSILEDVFWRRLNVPNDIHPTSSLYPLELSLKRETTNLDEQRPLRILLQISLYKPELTEEISIKMGI